MLPHKLMQQHKNHNFRASFQTGFRNPSTQDQYIGFNIGNAVLIGSAPDNLVRFTETLPVSLTGQAFTGSATTVMYCMSTHHHQCAKQ